MSTFHTPRHLGTTASEFLSRDQETAPRSLLGKRVGGCMCCGKARCCRHPEKVRLDLEPTAVRQHRPPLLSLTNALGTPPQDGRVRRALEDARKSVAGADPPPPKWWRPLFREPLLATTLVDRRVPNASTRRWHAWLGLAPRFPAKSRKRIPDSRAGGGGQRW